MKKSRFEVVVTSYGRNKNRNDEIKKHSRTNPDVQFKEFLLTRQKIDLESTISKKNQIKQKKKINVKMPHVHKKTKSEKWKFG